MEIASVGFTLASVVIALISVIVAYNANKQAKLTNLFSGFQIANQATIEYPLLLKDVHGVKLSEEECRNIAYLSCLLDAFQLESTDHKETIFLDKITSISANKERWEIMKEIYYGEFDLKFIEKIDNKFKQNCR